jgi:hypothetical protein
MCICCAVCEILCSPSDVAEYASLLGCDAAITTCQGHRVTSQEACIFSSVLSPGVIQTV